MIFDYFRELIFQVNDKLSLVLTENIQDKLN